jgi:hypothetical protein
VPGAALVPSSQSLASGLSTVESTAPTSPCPRRSDTRLKVEVKATCRNPYDLHHDCDTISVTVKTLLPDERYEPQQSGWPP